MLQLLIDDIARSYLNSSPRALNLGRVRTTVGDISPAALYLLASRQIEMQSRSMSGLQHGAVMLSFSRERVDELHLTLADRAALYDKNLASPMAFLPLWRAEIEGRMGAWPGESTSTVSQVSQVSQGRQDADQRASMVRLDYAQVLDVLYANHGAMLYDYLLSRPWWWNKTLPKDSGAFGILLEQVVRMVLSGGAAARVGAASSVLFDAVAPAHTMPAAWIEACARVMQGVEHGAAGRWLNDEIVTSLVDYTRNAYGACAHLMVKVPGLGMGMGGEGAVSADEWHERIALSVKRFDVCARHQDGTFRIVAAVDGPGEKAGAAIIAKRLSDKFAGLAVLTVD